MIGVLTLFGETDLQPVLKKLFMNNDLIFITENNNTSVQLIDRVNEHYRESDVIVIAATAVNMDTFSDLVGEIRNLEQRMRIILILNGNRTQYLDSTLMEYDGLRIDIIFDDNGFDTQDLVDLVKLGKLSKHKPKEEKKEPTAREIKQIPSFRKTDKISKSDKGDVPDTPAVKESFSAPTGKYTIGVFNLSRGAGATTAVASLAQYFALHGYTTKIADLSGTNALELVKLKDVEIGFDTECMDEFKKDSNLLIIDFGTPYDITPKGDNFKISYGYIPEHIREINKCTIKLIMGFSDVWNVGKIKFLLNNEQWKGVIDDSYIVLVSGDSRKLKSEYPDVNIMCRDDDYKDEILNTLREDE